MPILRVASIRACTFAIAMSLLLSSAGISVEARNQWDINHGASNPPIDPRFLPGGQFSGYVKAPVPMQGGQPGQPAKADFWKTQLANRVPAGTVLTVILENDLSSAKSQPGDTFTMTLEDGFGLDGQQLMIPPKSKIIGSVVNAQSAKALRHGNPGRLQVSLQTLVFPDGSHVPIYGFIDGNPSSSHKSPAKVRNLGQSFADYGQTLSGMAMSFVSGPGFMMNRRNRGLEFELDRGEALPIRLSKSLDLPNRSERLISQPQGPPIVGGDSSRYPYPPGAVGASSSNAVPGLIDPQGPVYVPPDPRRRNAPINVPGGTPDNAPIQQADPNAIFSQPIQPQTLNELPDPF